MLIEWRKAFEIGVPRVDREHRHLAGLVNSFYDLFRSGAGQDKVHTVLNLLVHYVEAHFRHEEALMAAAEFPGLADHRDEHEALTEQIFALNEHCAAGAAEGTRQTMEFLKGWLLDHILEQDLEIGRHLAKHGVPADWA